jgi:hypothetical protein
MLVASVPERLASKRKERDMGIPIDAVRVGDWLLCSRGPMVRRQNMGEVQEYVNKDPEGALMRVLGITAPFVLVKVYPVPCVDPEHPVLPTFNVTWKWSDAEFIRPSRGYLRAYLKLDRAERRVPQTTRQQYGRTPRSALSGPTLFFDKPQ